MRELYLANVGTVIWRAMKKETLDTFQPGDPPRGGRYFLDRLVPLLGEGTTPEVTLVGHSTGAVFINNLLRDVERLREEDPTGALAKFRFRHIAFLAPACTFSAFAGVLVDHEDLWQDFRMFTMTDEAEREDTLVPVVYPRSLLYFISGVLETDAAGEPEPAKPLVGLQRYYERPQNAIPDEIRSAREYVTGGRAVWSPADAAPGLSSGAVHHGDFDNDPKVRDSLRAMIEGRAQ